MKVTCFATASMVFEEANTRFAPLLKQSKEKLEKFRSACEVIDLLIDAFQCEALDVSVDEDTTDISVSLISPDVVVENGREHPFFRLVSSGSVKAVTFKTEEDNICTTFIFSGVWEKTM